MEKMRKAGLTVFSVAVALVVLVSGVSGENLKTSPSEQTIPYADDFATYNVQIYSIHYPGQEHSIKATIMIPEGGNTDLEFEFINSEGDSSGWKQSSESWMWGTPTGTGGIIMHVRAKSPAPQNNVYRFLIEDQASGEGGSESAGGTVTGTMIPEFATIAVPVGIVLVLAAFYFRKRGGEKN